MNTWQAPDPGYEARVRDSFQRQPFMQTLAVQLGAVQPGYCELKVPYKQAFTQQHGYFHAGVIATIADNAAGYAAFTLMEKLSAPLTVEFKLNLLAPGRGDHIVCRGRVVKNGRTLKICQSKVFAGIDGGEQLCAIAIVTMMELRDTPDHPKSGP